MIIVGVIVIVLLALIAIVVSGYKKAPPDTAFMPRNALSATPPSRPA